MNLPENLTFTPAEYDARTESVRHSLRERGIDVLLVTSPANLFWLTDYEASWYPPRLPVGVAVWADAPQTLFVDWSRHREFLPYDAYYGEASYVDYGTAPAQLARALASRSPHPGATVALEWASPTPAPAIVTSLASALAGHGMTVTSGDWIVDDLRIYTSPAERERIHRAARIADTTFLTLGEHLRPGMTELEVAALVTTLMSEGGSEVPAQHPLVSSGPTAWRDVHAFPSTRALEPGDVVSIDACAVVDRYHVNLSRVFCLGEAPARVRELLSASAASMEALCAAASRDADPAVAMAAAESALRERVPAEDIWWTGGYALGIAFPPSWVGHTYLANDGPRPVTLRDGYLSNFECVLHDRAQSFEVAAIDTVLVEDGILRPLSSIPREPLVV